MLTSGYHLSSHACFLNSLVSDWLANLCSFVSDLHRPQNMEVLTMAQNTDFHRRVTLGRTGLQVSRIGLAASYGIDADGLEAAYHERGVNYFYWGSMRKKSFGEGIRRLARQKREDLTVVIQSYSRFVGLLKSSVERALRDLQLQQAEVLLLGWHNHNPSPRILEAAQQLREQGKIRFLAVSCHNRLAFRQYIEEGVFDILMFRYNAAHRGAETQIFPHLERNNRPGTISYTATRWGQLLKPGKMPPGENTPKASDCYRFVLSQPCVDLCLAGPANREQLNEVFAALDRGPMDEGELAWMRRVGDHVHAAQ
jgi:aryl-alcohol dehydrogenase-like predicted oxidoreductase